MCRKLCGWFWYIWLFISHHRSQFWWFFTKWGRNFVEKYKAFVYGLDSAADDLKLDCKSFNCFSFSLQKQKPIRVFMARTVSTFKKKYFIVFAVLNAIFGSLFGLSCHNIELEDLSSRTICIPRIQCYQMLDCQMTTDSNCAIICVLLDLKSLFHDIGFFFCQESFRLMIGLVIQSNPTWKFFCLVMVFTHLGTLDQKSRRSWDKVDLRHPAESLETQDSSACQSRL